MVQHFPLEQSSQTEWSSRELEKTVCSLPSSFFSPPGAHPLNNTRIRRRARHSYSHDIVVHTWVEVRDPGAGVRRVRRTSRSGRRQLLVDVPSEPLLKHKKERIPGVAPQDSRQPPPPTTRSTNNGSDENSRWMSVRDTCKVEGSNRRDHAVFQPGHTASQKSHRRIDTSC